MNECISKSEGQDDVRMGSIPFASYQNVLLTFRVAIPIAIGTIKSTPQQICQRPT